jgi:RHS repeat-associated protein
MLSYDADGRLTADTIGNYAPPSEFRYPGQWLRQTRLTYIDRERVGSAENAAGMQDTTRTRYTGLGHVVRHEYRQPLQSAFGIANNYHSTETFSIDGLGNRYEQTDVTNLTSSTGSRNLTTTTPSVYEPDPGAPATGRLRFVISTQGTDALEYDASGNLAFQYRIPPPSHPSPVMQEDQVSFYGADGLLRVGEQRKLSRGTDGNEQNWHWWRTFEEYRYDALGRRVMVRTRRRCSEAALTGERHPCWMALMRRTVWDGTQELVEVQRPGGHDFDPEFTQMDQDSVATMLTESTSPTYFDPNPRFGVVIYTNALGLDRPLSVTRAQYVDKPPGYTWQEHPAYSLFPHWDWRGMASSGNVMDRAWNGNFGVHHGALKVCRDGNASLPCHAPTWRLPSFAFGLSVNVTPYEWNGTLIEDKEDGTGRAYRRNRTMDPATGRFTQEDPIGLAGGLNLYGFANGDPVNFSDPFGLCPPQDNNPNDCPGKLGALVMLGQMAPAMAKAIETPAEVVLAFSPGGLPLRAVRVGNAASKLVTGAARALAKRIGRNSVTVAIKGGFKRVDLVGKAHKGVPTPHVHTYEVHTSPVTGASRTRKVFSGPATRQDIIDAAREVGEIDP